MVMHLSALALAGCVLPVPVPVPVPASCPPGAHMRETARGPICIADQEPAGPGMREPVAMSPEPPVAPPEPPSAPPQPPSAPGPGAEVHRSWHDNGALAEEVRLGAGVLHGPWLRRDQFGRMVDKGFFDQS
jgi:hypothetical protein